MSTHTRNVIVTSCKTICIGHIHSIYVEMILDDCCRIKINPKRKWFADKGVDTLGHKVSEMPFYEFFRLFDIDCEDGAYFEDLKGKYCRLILDDDTDQIKAIQHITKDIWLDVEDLL